jgi:hypothetical protein
MRVVMSIEFVTNGSFKILSCMRQGQIDLSGKQYATLSQRQIAGITRIAYKTVNSIVKALSNNEYIIWCGTTKGRYSLVNKAIFVLATIKMGRLKNEYGAS